MQSSSYSNLDFGTKPSTSSVETVDVALKLSMVCGYAQAYSREASRVNPLKFDGLGLTVEELTRYFMAILAIRVASLSNGGYKFWRLAKRLYIPDFLQFVISTIGVVVDHNSGLRFNPTLEEDAPGESDYDELYATSDKIRSLKDDGLTASTDAFPRTVEGDPDVMGFVIIDGYVFGRTETQAPIASYIAAFLGMQLEREEAFKMLYRVRYDDVSFIESCLLHERSILCSTN